MTEHTPTIRTLAAAAVLVALALPGNARAQTSSATTPPPNANLKLGESGGQPKGYAFLLPTPPRLPFVHVQMRPEDTLIRPDLWTWKISDENAVKADLNFKWYAQASCPDPLTFLQVSGPGGTLTQNPLSNPIWGYFKTQSFTLDTVKNVCVGWANANACDPTEPGCQVWETFDLVGGVNPASPADRLRLKASCASGALPTIDYAPTVRLRCDRGPY